MLLELKRVSVNYGKAKAVSDVSLSIEAGSVAAIIGANGAGKSTILIAISALSPLKSGEIWFDGKRIDQMQPFRIVSRGLAHVPEGRRLFPHMSVLKNLMLGAGLRKNKEAVQSDLSQIFKQFPILADRRNQKAGTMSGGEQQMLAIARGLMSRPKLIMLDEPSSGLSPKMVTELVPVIRNIKANGVTVLLVEQNVPLALEVAGQAYALQVGRVVLEGGVEAFRENDDIKRAYLGEMC